MRGVMAHSQPAAHRGFPLIFMVRYLWPMGVYEGHFRKRERTLPASINLADLYRRLQRIPMARAFFVAR